MDTPESSPQGDPPDEATVAKHDDLGDRGGMARSIVFNWLWYAVVMISGFVVPRLIDGHLGKELLGIWDLGWSLIIYVQWLQVGIAGSIARYVARYRAIRDFSALNEAVNSSLAVLLFSSTIAVVLAFMFADMAPRLLPPETSAEAVALAGPVALLLILCAISNLIGSAVNSVLTGSERFDVLNLIRGGRDVAVLLGVIVLLLLGRGIVALGVLVFCGSVLSTVAYIVAARRVCPQLRYSLAHCSWPVARKMILFGGKNVVQATARSSLYQVNSLMVAAFLGAPALAVFARQRALVLHGLSFVKQYAQVFVPRSGALHAEGDTASLQRLLIQSSKYGLYAALPALLVLLIMGGPILNLWMGEDYEAPLVLAVLVVGHLFSVPQQSAYMILVGMNKHGRAAAYELAGAIVGIVLGFVLLGILNLGMMAAALAVAIPIALFPGLLMPIYACGVLQLKPVAYARAVFLGPCLANIPLACCLVAATRWLADTPFQNLAIGSAAGGTVTGLIYWRWVLPQSWRAKLVRPFRRCRNGARRLERCSPQLVNPGVQKSQPDVHTS